MKKNPILGSHQEQPYETFPLNHSISSCLNIDPSEYKIQVRIPVEELENVQSNFRSLDELLNYDEDRKKTILIKVKNALGKYGFELDENFYKDEEE